MLPKRVYLSLGSNEGDRSMYLERALAALAENGVTIERVSSTYETEPQEKRDQPWFLNLVVEGGTRLFPIQLLRCALGIERQLGRTRRQRAPNGPRPIDIDLLLYRTAVIDCPVLTVPHPRMRQRRFVLAPLVEIAPELRDPQTGRKYRDYLHELAGQAVRRVSVPLWPPAPASHLPAQ